MPIQQILLYTFVVILGIGLILLAHEMYLEFEKDAARDSLKIDLTGFGRDAYRYYYRPAYLGGGGNSFRLFMGLETTAASVSAGDELPGGVELPQTENGRYVVVAAAPDSVVFFAMGKVLGDNGRSPVQIATVVKIGGIRSQVLN